MKVQLTILHTRTIIQNEADFGTLWRVVTYPIHPCKRKIKIKRTQEFATECCYKNLSYEDSFRTSNIFRHARFLCNILYQIRNKPCNIHLASTCGPGTAL